MQTYLLGLDMGGTNSVLGLVDDNGNVIARESIKTQAYAKIEDYIAALRDLAVRLTEPFGGLQACRAMGAGVPNGNYYTGNIENAVNLPWHGQVPFADMILQTLGIPCHVTNDANAAAMGEMKYGAAKEMRNFIMITLGTGVGSGIVIDGKLLYGHDGFAGELGHVCADQSENARQCNCGLKGCLETYASANGMARTAKELMQKGGGKSLLAALDPEQITSKDVFDAAEKGDEVAKQIFDYTGTILGKQLANFIAFSAPEAIILFGGLTRSGHWIMDPVVKAMNESVMPLWRGKVKVLFSGLKEADAAILGAASIAE